MKIFKSLLSFFLLLFLLTSCTLPNFSLNNPGLDLDDEEELTEEEWIVAILNEYSTYPLPENFDPTGLSSEQIIAATNDPYAQYFTSQEYEEYYSSLQGNFVGIGVNVDYLQDVKAIRILTVFPNSPAKNANIEPGDLITHVEGVSVEELGGYNNALSQILGEAGTTVNITVKHNDTSEIKTITRASVTKQTVFYETLEDEGHTYGYVHITTFEAVTTNEMIQAILALEEMEVEGIVFDLRYNGGGLLRAVSEMLSFLLPDGDITHLRYKSQYMTNYDISSANGKLIYMGNEYSVDSRGNNLYVEHQLSVPVVVLTNGSTASAAELFTSSLLDYSEQNGFVKVVTIGEKSYGKGCMQTSLRVPTGSYLKLTVALYDPPTSANYNGIGIPATIEITPTITRIGDIYLNTCSDSVLVGALSYLTELIK